ncbi:TPM domain-containing protein [Helicobacter pylori]
MARTRSTLHPARLLAAVLAAIGLVLLGGGSALADAPFDVPEQITDRAGVLGDTDALQDDLDALQRDHDLQLFVVYVDSFDGTDPEQWTQQTYETSGMGSNDVLLAVAVEDRRYGMWTTEDSGLGPDDISRVQSEDVEPALADDDWAGAVTAAAEGLGSGGGGLSSSTWIYLVLGLIVVGGIALPLLVSRLRGGQTRAAEGTPQPVMAGVTTDQMRQDVGRALVDLDNAIRSSGEELAFAQAQFGEQATQQFTRALESARGRINEAFRIQQELDLARGAGRLGEPEERARLAEILELTRAADEELDAQEAEFSRLRDLEATVPQFLASLRTRATEVEARVPVARQELAGLSATHPREALVTLTANIDQAVRLVASAQGFVTTGEGHVAAGDRPSAVAAARAAEDALGQADDRLESVLTARTVLADATAALDTALASISSDLVDAERLRANDQMTVSAVGEARRAVELGTRARAGGDVIGALGSLERAEHFLDQALDRYRKDAARAADRLAKFDRRHEHVRARVATVEREIDRARGWVDSGPRTQIREAARLVDEARAARDTDLDLAGERLGEAEVLAERALSGIQRPDDFSGFGGMGGTGGRRSGIDVGSLVLGGILSGGFSGRGGGWGGSGGGFGGGFGGGGLGGGGGFGGGGRF